MSITDNGLQIPIMICELHITNKNQKKSTNEKYKI